MTPDLASEAAIANGARDAAGEGVIFDEDGSSTQPTINVAFAEGVESAFPFVRFQVTLSETSLAPVSVSYRVVTSGGTAADSDF